jgi:hypothetical protein
VATRKVTKPDPVPAVSLIGEPRLFPLKQVSYQEPFLGLFPPQKPIIEAITAAMKAHGFDRASPLRVWSIDDKLVVVDGHMRLQAATKAELEKVWVQEMAFPDVRAAMTWACQEQGERRRNLTKVEHRKYVVQAVRLLDRLQPQGGDHSSITYKASQKAKPLHKGFAFRSPSAKATAGIVGTSVSQVEAIRRVDRQGTEAQRAALTNGAGPQVIAKQLTPTKRSRSRKMKPSTSPAATPAMSEQSTPPGTRRSFTAILAEVPKPTQEALRKVQALILDQMPLGRTPPAIRERIYEFLIGLAASVRAGSGRL